MPAKWRRWQARIEIIRADISPCEMIYVYGETIDKLLAAARDSLRKKQPSHFNNVGDHIVGRFEYCYSNGKMSVPVATQRAPVILEEGWWVRECLLTDHLINTTSGLPLKKLKDLDQAIDHFVELTLIPEKGPDYESSALIEKSLQLPLLEKVLREQGEYPVNDLIQRGWHIIALEYKGELSVTGELKSRQAVFVMGHPDKTAASFSLDTGIDKMHGDFNHLLYRKKKL